MTYLQIKMVTNSCGLAHCPLSVQGMVTGIGLLVVFMLAHAPSASGMTCSSSTCFNGGTCLVNNATGGTSCECPEHTVGVNCACDSSVCQNNRPCVNGVETFTCDCGQRYYGAFCQNKVGECGDSTCEYGSCVNTLGSYLCTCNPGYTGSNCDIDIDECTEDVSSCGPKRECINTFGSYRCNCTAGYEGYNCAGDVDECAVHNCNSNGLCTNNHHGGYKCSCFAGYDVITDCAETLGSDTKVDDDDDDDNTRRMNVLIGVLIPLSVLAVIIAVLAAVIKAVKSKDAVKRLKAARLQLRRDSNLLKIAACNENQVCVCPLFLCYGITSLINHFFIKFMQEMTHHNRLREGRYM